MTRLNELRLISRVAQMYHLEGRRQAEIAQHLRLSQATVSRMLKRAEAEDIVRTSVTPPLAPTASLRARFARNMICRRRSSLSVRKIGTAPSWPVSERQRLISWR